MSEFKSEVVYDCGNSYADWFEETGLVIFSGDMHNIPAMVAPECPSEETVNWWLEQTWRAYRCPCMDCTEKREYSRKMRAVINKAANIENKQERSRALMGLLFELSPGGAK